MRGFIKRIIYRLRGTTTIEALKKSGLKIGNNCTVMHGTIIDPSHCWLIEIGDNVTLAPNVHILAHDASTKFFLGYTKIANVKIGNDVFIGAGSVVTKSIPNGHVAIGNPARIICTMNEYIAKNRRQMGMSPVYDETYTVNGNITIDKKDKMKKELKNKIGYVI